MSKHGVFLVLFSFIQITIFLYSNSSWTNTEICRISIFSANAGKYVQDKLHRWTLFMKWSNTKLSAHYRIVCLYSINICDDIFVSYEFWNMFKPKAVKVGYTIIIVITIIIIIIIIIILLLTYKTIQLGPIDP